ncbi:MAG TPA: anthranilate phosphoribosyltransferase [Fimbriimonadaceae bacterium]|nr:anthranilate phosphoribosyltransferase [Fimbriimonadaceae bacterium]
MSHAPILEVLLGGRDLTAEDARALMAAMFDEDVPGSVKGAALALLRQKGATGVELAEFARILRENAVTVDAGIEDLVDTCGTGGGIPSFNLSTAAALIACGAGAKVAKHGNRGVTSSCGSADVLEALGVKLIEDPARLRSILQSVGIAFLFAPTHHPTMKKVGPVRRELGFRTVFNQLGPLANPFGAKNQVVGVYDPALLVPMAEALRLLGSKRALVVHGADGLDEISPCGTTYCAELQAGEIRSIELAPTDFGMEPLPPSAIACGEDHGTSAAILKMAISEEESPRAFACLPNAAAALVVGGIAGTYREGAELARAAIASGAAFAKLEEFAKASQA